MRTTTVSECPCCGKLLDAATDLEDPSARPRPGDYSICMYCTTFLMFDENTILMEMTEEDIGEMLDEARIELTRIRKCIQISKEGKLH